MIICNIYIHIYYLFEYSNHSTFNVHFVIHIPNNFHFILISKKSIVIFTVAHHTVERLSRNTTQRTNGKRCAT